MLSKEKSVVSFNLFFRSLRFHLIFWYCALLLFAFLTGNDLLFSKYIELTEVNNQYFTNFFLTNFFVATSIAILLTFSDTIFKNRLTKLGSSWFMVLFSSALYFVLGFILLMLAPLSPKVVLNIQNQADVVKLLPAIDIHFTRFMVYFYLASFFNNFLQSVMKKVGRGNFKNWIFGIMNKPREAERIFMFIDMKSSTRIAEKLSHERFSHLVQDVFNDMAIVDNYMGEIYQYMGDGAIISWSLKKGLKNNNFIKAFYGFANLISKREDYYHKKYDLIPKFKAGIHVGKVMVLQVGRIRRDISYNGDTLNTTARIESMCNEYNKSLLISGDLYNMVHPKDEFHFREVGNIRLKGKRKMVGIYSVREKRASKRKLSPYIRLMINKFSFFNKKVKVSLPKEQIETKQA
jgi:adenylate cyclase